MLGRVICFTTKSAFSLRHLGSFYPLIPRLLFSQSCSAIESSIPRDCHIINEVTAIAKLAGVYDARQLNQRFAEVELPS